MPINKIQKLVRTYFQAATLKDYTENSEKMLMQLSNNYTIDTESVSIILQYLNTEQYDAISQKQQNSAAKLFLAFNSLRNIVFATFAIVSENDIYQLLCMVYEDVITKWSQNKNKQYILYCYILSKQFYPILTKTRHTVPKFFGWAASVLKNLITQQFEDLQLANDFDQNKNNSTTVEYLEDTEKVNWIQIMEKNLLQDCYQNNLRVIYLISAQVSNYINISVKKEIVKCQFLKSIKQSLEFLLSKLYENSDIKNNLQNIIKISFTDCVVQNQPIYIEKPIQFKLLQPRMISEQPSTKIKLLKKKRNKLKKKIENEFRGQLQNRIQQQQIIEDTRKQKIARQQKKQIFIMQKQTEQAKKMHKQVKRFKQIQKKRGGGKKK